MVTRIYLYRAKKACVAVLGCDEPWFWPIFRFLPLAIGIEKNWCPTKGTEFRQHRFPIRRIRLIRRGTPVLCSPNVCSKFRIIMSPHCAGPMLFMFNETGLRKIFSKNFSNWRLSAVKHRNPLKKCGQFLTSTTFIAMRVVNKRYIKSFPYGIIIRKFFWQQ